MRAAKFRNVIAASVTGLRLFLAFAIRDRHLAR